MFCIEFESSKKKEKILFTYHATFYVSDLLRFLKQKIPDIIINEKYIGETFGEKIKKNGEKSLKEQIKEIIEEAIDKKRKWKIKSVREWVQRFDPETKEPILP